MMLSRIGNSLFWLGRYLERAEHLARYIEVQYTSSLDAPLLQKKELILESIRYMDGALLDNVETTDSSNKVLLKVTLDPFNPNSIASAIQYARENARSAKDMISSELWEAVNTYYHLVRDYPAKVIKQDGPYEFCQQVIERATVARGLIDKTLIHDTAWSIINVGIKLEGAIQTVRIVRSKVHDINSLDKKLRNGPLENYQWTTLMKSMESFDMSRRFYKKSPQAREALEFLILNLDFPNSLSFCLGQMQQHVHNIAGKASFNSDEVGFYIGKLRSEYLYITVDDILQNTDSFLDQTLDRLSLFGEKFENQYLNY